MTESLLTLCERIVETSRKIDVLLKQMQADLIEQEARANANRTELLAQADKLNAAIRSIA